MNIYIKLYYMRKEVLYRLVEILLYSEKSLYSIFKVKRKHCI